MTKAVVGVELDGGAKFETVQFRNTDSLELAPERLFKLLFSFLVWTVFKSEVAFVWTTEMPREEDDIRDEDEEANEFGEKDDADVTLFEVFPLSSLLWASLSPLNALSLCFRGPLSCWTAEMIQNGPPLSNNDIK